MLTYYGKMQGVLKNHQAVYSFICIGITASLIFWPLLSSIFCGLLFLYWVITPGKRFSLQSYSTKRLLLFAGLYLPIIIGVVYSSDTSEAAFLLQQKVPLILFPVVFGSLPILTSILRKKILWALVFSTVVGCWLGLIVGMINLMATGSPSGLHGYSLVVLHNMHPVVLGLCCLLSIAFLLEEIKVNGNRMSRSLRIAHLAIVTFLMLFLWLMENRNNLICLSIIAVIYIVRIFRSTYYRLFAFAALVTIWVCILLTVPAFNQRWKELINESNNAQTNYTGVAFPDSRTARLKIWNSVVDVVKNNIVIGVGSGDAQAELDKNFIQKNYAFASYNHCNAHNQYLQETVTFGIPGLVIFLLCLLIPFSSMLQSKEDRLYVVFLILFAVVCMSESLLQLSKGVIWYAFFNAVFAFRATDQ